ncbi:MAG: orotidine-5'-phosphate decarboxylase [Alphaproteobacteria bacterium]
MIDQPTNPVYCALDTTDTAHAVRLAGAVRSFVGGFKIGLEAFYAMGAGGYSRIANVGLPIFLDLKLHDIPNTVAGAVRALAPLRPAIINVHASGGVAMMRAAMAAAMEAGPDRPKIIAVTVLTSLDGDDLASTGITGSVSRQALRLAELASHAGLDGVVCGAGEARAIKAQCGADFLTVVPGIRPVGVAVGDQKQTMMPVAALAAGADILVIGRAITAAPTPGEAAAAIARGLLEEAA